MRLRVYRSLLGSSFRQNSIIKSKSNSLVPSIESAIAALCMNKSHNSQQPEGGAPSSSRLNIKTTTSHTNPHHPSPSDGWFDGVVINLCQFDQLVQSTHYFSPPPPSDQQHYDNNEFGVICQLPMGDDFQCHHNSTDMWDDLIKKPLEKLADLLRQAEENKIQHQQHTQHGHISNRPILDMVILEAPVFEHYSHQQEYLSRVLPLASMFLESIPPSILGISDRSNAQGKPLGQHVRGVSHWFGQTKDLQDLGSLADVFPPTRFVLHPNNLRTTASFPTSDQQTTTDGGHNNNNHQHVPSTSDPYGISMELEGVVENTDVLRVSPASFYVDDDGEVQERSIFGAGTLFGQVWCAQQLDGALETYVICDENDDVDGTTEESMVGTIAHNVREAYATSKKWRDGAEDRRKEEMNAASKARREGMSNAWMVGRYGPEVAESVTLFGLDLKESNDSEEGLSVRAIQKRWQALAFRSHPDTNSHGALKQSPETMMTFVELRHHYLTLMEAATQKDV